MQHDCTLDLAPLVISTYVSPITHLIHYPQENITELDAKYATLLQNDVFRNFVIQHDYTSGHAPSANGPVYHPGLSKNQIVYLFEDLHYGNGMDALNNALNNDGFVVIMDEWQSPVVYNRTPESFHNWMTNPVSGTSSFTVFNS